ncbi:MAG: hypothetical protein Q8P27_01685 [Candidatus Peregrinibacteria bacterium]|nr:hypothetical protein [Candidatus Peregrinibacteria bacterium]
MSTHPITDIHESEKEAKKLIEESKKQNDKRVIEAREKEEKSLEEFGSQEKEAGQKKIMTAKTEAATILRDNVSKGGRENATNLKQAADRSDQAVRTVVKTFKEYIGL